MRRALFATTVLIPVAVAALTLPHAGGGRAQEPEVAHPSVAPSTSQPSSGVDPREAGFRGAVSPIDAEMGRHMSASWRPGCPVGLSSLRLLKLSFWGFDGRSHVGELVVHADVSRDVVAVFRRLYDARFPIERMELVDAYGGDDDRSMAANNTSAFNCRHKTNSTSWSEHSYGRAIDINPIQNPYVAGREVSPPAGARYADRSLDAEGMITTGDPVVEAFDAIGWGWGGAWRTVKDYQHFSRSGS